MVNLVHDICNQWLNTSFAKPGVLWLAAPDYLQLGLLRWMHDSDWQGV